MTDTIVMTLSTSNDLSTDFAGWEKYVEVSATPDGRIIVATNGGTGVTSVNAMESGTHLLRLDIDIATTPAAYQLSVDGDMWLDFDDPGNPNGFRDSEFVGTQSGLREGEAKAVKIKITTTGSLG
jgi:hypothetical protein